jgi:hypothetical protein
MSHLTRRLRMEGNPLMKEAADEIERLENTALSSVDGEAVYCVPVEHEDRIVYDHSEAPIPMADNFVLYRATPSVQKLQEDIRVLQDCVDDAVAAGKRHIAEVERLKELSKTWATRAGELEAERDQLRQQLAQPAGKVGDEIAEWLEEAAEQIASWGAYASEYFQEKHDLSADVEEFRERAVKARALLSAPVVKAGEKTLRVEVQPFKESNGNRWWSVFLAYEGQTVFDWHEVYSDEIEGRALYEADCLRHFLGQGPKPDILAYDTEAPQPTQSAPVVKAEQLAAGQVPEELFDRPGPQLTEARFGREPSLRNVLESYYREAGTDNPQVDAQEYISAIAAPVPGTVGQQWQPIETAPKDGTEILVLDGWMWRGDPEKRMHYVIRCVSFDTENSCWGICEDGETLDDDPHYWMPRAALPPAPPQAAPEQEGK